MKNISNILLISFYLLFLFSSCKTINTTNSTRRVESVLNDVKQNINMSTSIEEIPILAWWGVQEHTIERYNELKECGFDNNLSWLGDAEAVLNIANEAGIKLLLHNDGLKMEPEKNVSYFKNNPALIGYFLTDEPNSKEFIYLGNWARRIQMEDKNHFIYVNLLPNNASIEQLGTSTYREYVQLFLKEVPVPFLSFDHYPIRVTDDGVRSLNTGWYENLEIISDEANKAGIPFWAFALSTAHKPYPIPTLADIRLQVYSNLAYGAQGIQYFTYWTPKSGTWDFHDGPINNMGQKTLTWYVVQQMNREIKGLSNVFLGAKVIKVEHITTDATGRYGKIPTGTTRFDFIKRPKEASKIKTFDIPNNTNALVSFLKNRNRCYMVIVNRNLEGGDNATFTITGGAGLQLINKDGTAVKVSSKNSTQTVTPGDALIYGWDVKN